MQIKPWRTFFGIDDDSLAASDDSPVFFSGNSPDRISEEDGREFTSENEGTAMPT